MGVIILSLFLLLSLGLLPTIELSIICASFYVFLALWETLYLKQYTDMNLKREFSSLVITFILLFFSLYITSTWVLISLFTYLFIINIIYSIYFSSIKPLRIFLLISILFSIIIGSIQLEYIKEATNKPILLKLNSNSSNEINIQNIQVGTNKILSLINNNSKNKSQDNLTIYTNIYPASLLRYMQKTEKVTNLNIKFKYQEITPLFLIQHIWNPLSSLKDKSYYLFNLETSLLFQTNPKLLQTFLIQISKIKNNNISFLIPYSLKKQILSNSNIYTELIINKEKKIIISSISQELHYLFTYFTTIAEWLTINNNNHNESLKLYQDLLSLFQNQNITEGQKYTHIIEKVIFLYEKTQQFNKAIFHLEKVLYSKNKGSKKTAKYIKKEELLAILYFYNGQLFETENIIKKLINKNPSQALEYYKWLFKVFIKKGNVLKWLSLQTKVRRYKPKNKMEVLEKKILVEQIDKIIKKQETWEENMKKTKLRELLYKDNSLIK